MVERILEEQVKEAGFFISLMSRLVQTYPNWASQVVSRHPGDRRGDQAAVLHGRRAEPPPGRVDRSAGRHEQVRAGPATPDGADPGLGTVPRPG